MNTRRDFTLLWSGQAVAQLGSRGYGVAIMLWVLAVTGSPTAVGLVSTVTLAVFTLAALPAGWAVDRFDRRVVMIVTDVVCALAAASLAVGAWTGSTNLAHVLVVGAVLGAGWAVRPLAEDAAVPNVLAPDDIPRGIAMLQGRSYATGLAGPPLASALFLIAPAIPFATQAVAYLVAGSSAAAVRRPLQAQAGTRASGGSVREGWAFVGRNRFIRTTCGLAAIGGFVLNAYGLVLVVYLARAGVSAAAVGVILALAYGAGLLGSAAAARLHRRVRPYQLVVGSALAGAAATASLIGSHLWAACVGYAVLLFVQPLWRVPVSARYVGLVPDRLRGRVGGVTSFVSSIPIALAPLVAGLLAEHLTIAQVGWCLSALLGVRALIAVGSRAIRDEFAPGFGQQRAAAWAVRAYPTPERAVTDVATRRSCR